VEPILLRVREAAELLNVSKWTIYRWIEEGRLQGTKIGRGSMRVFKNSIIGLVDGARTKYAPPSRTGLRRSGGNRAAGVKRSRPTWPSSQTGLDVAHPSSRPVRGVGGGLPPSPRPFGARRRQKRDGDERFVQPAVTRCLVCPRDMRTRILPKSR